MLFALLAIVVRAQDAHVMGHVADEKGEHLHYVTVMLKGTTIGSVDLYKHYTLELNAGVKSNFKSIPPNPTPVKDNPLHCKSN
jgi:hypothetical protein